MHAAESAGNEAVQALALAHLANIDYEDRDFAAAADRAKEALAIGEQIGFGSPVCEALVTLGNLYTQRGEHARAAHCFQDSLGRMRALKDGWHVAPAATQLGLLEMERGNHEQCEGLLAEGLAVAQRMGARHNVIRGLEGFARLAAAQGQGERALQLAGAAAAARDAIGAKPLPTEQAKLEAALHPFRARLGAALWSDARTIGLDQAIAIALEDAAPDRRSAKLARLTAREREIAELVGQGTGNRGIAAALVIDVRTVETHVRHILRKLQLSSRQQVPAYLRDHGASTPTT